MDDHPGFTESLLDKLTSVTVDYLNYQIESGANVVQLFESFAESMSKQFYEKWAFHATNEFSEILIGTFPPSFLPKNFQTLNSWLPAVLQPSALEM